MTTRKVPKKMSMPKTKPARPTSLRNLIIELEAKFQQHTAEIDRRFEEMDRRLTASHDELRRDFEVIAARLLKAQQESFRSQFGALDDKYRDLPDRVATLEDRVGITR